MVFSKLYEEELVRRGLNWKKYIFI
jgi:hypothetical protein